MSESEGFLYIATSNDCISSIADQHGLFWKTLWLHPKNEKLKTLRKDPNILLAGDQVFVPEKELKEEPGSTKMRLRFRRKGVPALLLLRFCNGQEPRKNVPYVLVIDGNFTEGTTDSDGRIKISIPPGATEGKLILRQGGKSHEYVLALGTMDPVTEPRGAIKRLESLGYDCGFNKDIGLQRALQSFQANNNLPLTCKLDAATMDKLCEKYGC